MTTMTTTPNKTRARGIAEDMAESKRPRLEDFKKGDMVILARVRHAELLGRSAIVLRTVKSRNVVCVELINNATGYLMRYDAYPANLEREA